MTALDTYMYLGGGRGVLGGRVLRGSHALGRASLLFAAHQERQEQGADGKRV